jgi:hypothetical protein
MVTGIAAHPLQPMPLDSACSFEIARMQSWASDDHRCSALSHTMATLGNAPGITTCAAALAADRPGLPANTSARIAPTSEGA